MIKIKLTVRVERWTNNNTGPLTFKLYENQKEIDDCSVIPFDSIRNTLRFLYGDDVIVSFILDSFTAVH